MRPALFIGLGALGGFAVAFWMRPASKEYCCKKVAEGTRDRVREACGPFGDLCAGLGDVFNLWDSAPSILESLGL